MKRVRFAPSPTGSLHVGNALSAVANRRFGDWLLLRIDDTDPARNVPGGEEAILEDLAWLGVEWDEGPVRQSERADRYRQAAAQRGTDRAERATLLRGGGPRLPRRARPAAARRPPRPRADPPARDRGDRRHARCEPGRAGGRGRVARTGAARRARSGRGSRVRGAGLGAAGAGRGRRRD